MLKSIDLGKEAILPLILKMSWPSIIAMMAMSIYNFIDSFWLARLSSEALAALTVCFPIQMIFAAIGVGTGVGAA
jgi:Na+-driven multidrug efflux pump